MNIQQYQMQSRGGGLMNRVNDGSYSIGGTAYLGPDPSKRPRPGMRVMPGQFGDFVPARYQMPEEPPMGQPMGPPAGGGMVPYVGGNQADYRYRMGGAMTPGMPQTAMKWRRRRLGPERDANGNLPGEWDYQQPPVFQQPPMQLFGGYQFPRS